MDEIKVEERRRVYNFGEWKVNLDNVVSIKISKSGNHRVKTKDGLLHIISPGWISIEIDADDWTF